MSDSDFSARFLDTVGNDLDLIARASAGKLHDFISYKLLAKLIANGSALPPRIPGIADEIHHACYVGYLKARLIPGSPGVPVTHGEMSGCVGSGIYTKVVGATDPDYIIHRDAARRYFQALDLMPEPGTPLWCWLRGKPASEAKTLRPDQQDKADFQQLCMERWELSPLVPITGPSGMGKLIGDPAYLRLYKLGTLEGWAREVAPEEVKNRRGRRRKISV